jgi:flavodoxin
LFGVAFKRINFGSLVKKYSQNIVYSVINRLIRNSGENYQIRKIRTIIKYKESEMKKAAIIVNSKTGTTHNYAEVISQYLQSKGLETQVSSVQAYHEDMLENVDYVLLGCWTNGLMVLLQHPEQKWVDFAAKLPSMPDAKVALFTTYKILTGSMFRNMAKYLKGKFTVPSLELKSRDGSLSEKDVQALDRFISRV